MDRNFRLRNHVIHQNLCLLRTFRRNADVVLIEFGHQTSRPGTGLGRNVCNHFIVVRVLLLDHRDRTNCAVQISARHIEAMMSSIVSQIVDRSRPSVG